MEIYTGPNYRSAIAVANHSCGSVTRLDFQIRASRQVSNGLIPEITLPGDHNGPAHLPELLLLAVIPLDVLLELPGPEILSSFW